MERFYNKIKLEHIHSTNTMRHYYILLNNIFTHSVKWKIIKYNPNEPIDAPRVKKKEASAYNFEQVNKLLGALDNEPIEHSAFIILTLESGLRREEINDLKW